MDASLFADVSAALGQWFFIGAAFGFVLALLLARTFLGLVEFLDAWFDERLDRARDRWRARRFLSSVQVISDD